MALGVEMIISDDPEIKKYVEEVFRRADEGDLEALYEKAALYDLGEYVEVDKEKASQIFKAAADRGHVHSMWIHACELLWGKGSFPRSLPDGMRYLDTAIENGSAQACITKARLYLLGEFGMAKDTEKSNALRSQAKN